MTQENMTVVKGVLQAYSEKNSGILIGNRWYNSALPATTLASLKRKPVVAEVTMDGRSVTKLEIDESAPVGAERSFGARRPFGRTEEDSRRIARQACLNTATAIYDLALRTTQGSFATPANASTSDVAQAIKAEVMRIAKDLEAHVYE